MFARGPIEDCHVCPADYRDRGLSKELNVMTRMGSASLQSFVGALFVPSKGVTLKGVHLIHVGCMRMNLEGADGDIVVISSASDRRRVSY